MAIARAAVTGLCMALAVVGCQSRSVVTVAVASVEITPSSFTLVQGDKESARAVARGPGGEVLSGRSVTWSVDAADIATVDATGMLQALRVGKTTLRAEVEGVRAVAPVTVLVGPSIALSSDTVLLGAFSGSDSDPQTVSVENGGNGVLSGLSTSVTYGAGEPTGWLTAGLSGTDAPAQLTMRASAAALKPGSYQATVTVTSPVMGGLSQDVAVRLDVQPAPPSIALDASEISFAAAVGGQVPAVQDVAVTNAGDGSLSGLGVSITYSSGEPTGWLQATLAASIAPTTLTLKASPGPLAAGTYHATVDVLSADAANSPQTLTVVFSITPPGGAP